MKMNVLVSAFISYSILMHIKYSVLCFKLSVKPLMYDVKMKSGGCASPCSVLRTPLWHGSHDYPGVRSLPTPVAESRVQVGTRCIH